MEKVIKIQKAPAKRGYIEALKISGNYLKEHGFNMGDSVRLKIEMNKITIEMI
ncbi:MAG TPA: hypothetical protein VK152_00360 [Paludibacter sp.]|nr:hypothetical protein [Paludibacter sp.]